MARWAEDLSLDLEVVVRLILGGRVSNGRKEQGLEGCGGGKSTLF